MDTTRPAHGAFSTRPAQFEASDPPSGEDCRSLGKSAFEALGKDGEVTGARVIEALEAAGLERTDPRLKQSMERLEALSGEMLDSDSFCEALSADECRLVARAARGELISGDFPRFRQRIANIFHYAASEESGEIATYIPELAKQDPDSFSLGACTIDGQRFELGAREGDAQRRFCVQSAMKPLNYAVALELGGQTLVHTYVGREPSGQSFNEITLDKSWRPHNPMINAGAIMTTALIRPTNTVQDRFAFIRRVWASAAGGEEAGFDEATFESERNHADRNYALAYFMREHGGFPPEAGLFDSLELYFRCCAIEMDARRLSMVAATLANGGVCPVTERRVFQRETVKNVLSLMLSCGMYDFSGEYAFTVGLPAKSGVSGAMMIVVPGVAGFALHAPRLGPQGNPQRGVEFSRQLVKAFPWHVYAPIVVDPALSR